MADTAYQRQYKSEFIAAYEDRVSVLQGTCTRESVVKGNEAIFLVAGSGSATAVTRGVNGLIPARADSLTQTTATLREYHDLVRKTDFNIFASQGDQRRIMQMTSQGVINRQIDDLIIAQLDTATNDTGTAAIATQDMVVYALTILGNNFVNVEDADNVFAVITPAFLGYLHQIPEFASADYVEVKPLVGPIRRYRRWMGVNWIMHPRLTNSVGDGGTGASEQCFMYHRDAIGWALDRAGVDAAIGDDEEQAYTFVRHSVHAGAVLLQNSGVVMMRHNASSYAAQ